MPKKKDGDFEEADAALTPEPEEFLDTTRPASISSADNLSTDRNDMENSPSDFDVPPISSERVLQAFDEAVRGVVPPRERNATYADLPLQPPPTLHDDPDDPGISSERAYDEFCRRLAQRRPKP